MRRKTALRAARIALTAGTEVMLLSLDEEAAQEDGVGISEISVTSSTWRRE